MEALAIGYLGSSEEAELRVMLHLSQTFLEQGREEEALEALTEALKASKERQRIRPLHTRGNIHLRADRLDEAERDFREIVKLDKEAVLGLAGLAGIASKRGDLDAVVAHWERINEIQGENPAWRLKLARELRRRAARKDRPTWREEMMRALAIVDETVKTGDESEEVSLNANGHNERGMILLDLRQFPEAIAEFETASEKDPRYLRPRNNLGVTHMRLAHGALVASRKATDAARRAGLEKQSMDHRQAALDWFADVLEVDPENAKAHYNRGELFARLRPQDLESAKEELKKAIVIDPAYDKAKRLLQQIEDALR